MTDPPFASGPPGPLLGVGRDCDVYDVGRGRVLRRSRDGRSTEREARVMAHARAHGYPVPEVHDADGPDLVMDRVEGTTMVSAIARRPWQLDRHARSLADLVDRIGAIPAGDLDLPAPFGPGSVLGHLDLHPLNVMVTADGPVVIDWTNAACVPPGAEVANTWLTLAVGEIDGPVPVRLAVRTFRGLFVRRFLAEIDGVDAAAMLGAVRDHKRSDPNLSTAEKTAMDAVVSRAGP